MKTFVWLALSLLCFTKVVSQKIDTVYVHDKNPVVLIFADKFKGEVGNNDYEVVPKENTLRIKAKTRNPVQSFVGVDVVNGDRFYFILVFREVLPKVIYQYKPSDLKSVEIKDTKVLISTLDGEENTQEVPVGTKSGFEKPTSQSGKQPGKTVNKINGGKKPKTLDEIMVRLNEIATEDKNDLKKYGFAVTNGNMVFKLVNVFTYEDYFIFKFQFINKASIKFNFSMFDISIDSKKGIMKNKVQGANRFNIIKQFPAEGELESVGSGETQDFIVITDTEEYSENGKMKYVINERNNKRNMYFEMDSKFMLNAQKIAL